MMGNKNITESLVRFVVDSRMEDLPAEVIETSKKCFLDWIGVAFGGVKDPSVRIMIDLIREIGGKRQASVLGYAMKTNVLNAALVNGTMSHVLDYDDAHSDTRSHPSAPLVPGLLSVAEWRKQSGSQLITAFVVGFEVSTRIGLILGKSYYESGWHATSILGRLGSAAGTGKLLGLNERQLATAFGLAATQAGGLRRVFGTMGKPFHAGKAAMDGVLSAFLSQRGFTAPEDILDGKPSFLNMFSHQAKSSHIVEGLGKDWQVLNVSFKPYAACLLIHPVMDGLIWIKNQYQVPPHLIEKVYLEVAPLCLSVTDNASPKDGLEGKFSLYFCAAIAILHGQGKNNLFTDEAVQDPSVKDLMGKIKATSNPSLKEIEANVKVRLRNRTEFSREVFFPKGDSRNPMTLDEIKEKFRDLVQPVLSKKRTEQIVEVIQGLESLDDVSKLLKLCHLEKG